MQIMQIMYSDQKKSLMYADLPSLLQLNDLRKAVIKISDLKVRVSKFWV